MSEWSVQGLLVLNGVLLVAVLVVLLWLVLRRTDPAAQREQAERLAREQRSEQQDSARAARQELAGALALFQQALLAQSGDVARTQNEQIDTFRTQLAAMQQQLSQSLQQAASQGVAQGQTAREAQDAALQRFGSALAEQLQSLSLNNAQRLAEVRQTVDARLAALQQGNEAKLEQMRATVDEKLHATLEQRLGESFKQVAERLEQVHQGLGDMRNLARDVGSLNRVLSNVTASEAKDLDGKPIRMGATATNAKDKLKQLDPERAKQIVDPEPESPFGAG